MIERNSRISPAEPLKEFDSSTIFQTLGFIHAGGGGTRLKNKGFSDLDKWPKVLLDIPYSNQEFQLSRATMIDRTLLELHRAGFNNFLCLTSSNNGTDLIKTHIEAFYGDGRLIPVEMNHYVGNSSEGAAMSAYYAIVNCGLKGLCFMTPPDTLFPFHQLESIIKFHIKAKADLTWTVTSNPGQNAQNTGRVILDSELNVIKSFEKNKEDQGAELFDPSMRFTSTGVIVVDTSIYLRMVESYMAEKGSPQQPLDIWRDVISLALPNYKILGYDIGLPAQDLGEVDRLKDAGGLR